jgi:hypothetical protein
VKFPKTVGLSRGTLPRRTVLQGLAALTATMVGASVSPASANHSDAGLYPGGYHETY